MAPAENPEAIGWQLDAVDIEERLQLVKLAVGRPWARRPGRRFLVAAGSACTAATVVLTYLWWRSR